MSLLRVTQRGLSSARPHPSRHCRLRAVGYEGCPLTQCPEKQGAAQSSRHLPTLRGRRPHPPSSHCAESRFRGGWSCGRHTAPGPPHPLLGRADPKCCNWWALLPSSEGAKERGIQFSASSLNIPFEHKEKKSFIVPKAVGLNLVVKKRKKMISFVSCFDHFIVLTSVLREVTTQS